MREIKLNDGQTAIVDDEDYQYFSRLKWKAIKKENNWYAVLRKVIDGSKGRKQTTIYMHELLIDLENRDCITFKNKNTMDYRKENLFGVSKGVSQARTRKRMTTHGGRKPTSKYKGVCRRIKKGKLSWEVRIAKDAKTYYVGSFQNQKEAAIAYNERAEELYGEFGYKNKV